MSGQDMRKLMEATEVDEKWAGGADVKKLDKYGGDEMPLADLRKKRNALRKKEERTAGQSRDLKRMNFAIRSRTGWGKASESVINESKEQVLNEMMNLNALQQMSDAQRLAVVDWLGTTYDEWVAEDAASEDLMIGVDILLETLGREGHYFTEETELDEMAGRKPWFIEVLDRDPNPASAVDFLFRWKKMTEEFKAAHPALYEEIESEEGVSYFVTEYMDIRQLKQYVETGEYEGH